VVVQDELGFEEYKAKIEALPQFSRVDVESAHCQPFEGSKTQWQLIQAAVTYSDQAYGKSPINPDCLVFEPVRDIKATVFDTESIGGQETFVVAFRGSVTLGDWSLNFNGKPTVSKKLLDGTVGWHQGFLRVAEKMEPRIVQVTEYLRARQSHIKSILFTGHSAGGAIAQIFYAASQSPQSSMSKAVSGLIVHCITFGAPPVASIRIPRSPHNPGGEFIAVINEGDPVAEAQEDYLITLIAVYVLSKHVFQSKYPNGRGFTIPAPVLRVSGDCVVLREVAPDDEHGLGVDALKVEGDLVEQRLFGDPFVHLKDVYLNRVQLLAEQVL